MRKCFLGISLLAFLLIDIVVIDVLWPAKLTHEQEIQALQYLENNDLSEPPYRFTHDGCTYFPDVLPGHNFKKACLQQDIAYWAGGPHQLKERADLAFFEDVKHTGPLGESVFLPAVQFAITHFSDTWITKLVDAEWGYGWDFN